MSTLLAATASVGVGAVVYTKAPKVLETALAIGVWTVKTVWGARRRGTARLVSSAFTAVSVMIISQLNLCIPSSGGLAAGPMVPTTAASFLGKPAHIGVRTMSLAEVLVTTGIVHSVTRAEKPKGNERARCNYDD